MTNETPTLPPPGASGPEDHDNISRWFLHHAKIELEEGHRLQASEKAWAAVAHTLKALAQERGWNHASHAHLRAIGSHIANLSPYGQVRAGWNTHFANLNGSHENFYENQLYEESVAAAIVSAEAFMGLVNRVRAAPVRPFTVRNESDQYRLALLLGTPRDTAVGDYPIGKTDSRGFVQSLGDDGNEETPE